MRGANATCILQKPTETSSSTSDSGTTWTALVEFPCRLQPASTQEKLLYDRETTQAVYRLIVAYSRPIAEHVAEMKEKNRIKIPNTENELEAQIFDIIGVKTLRHASRIHHFDLTLRETK